MYLISYTNPLNNSQINYMTIASSYRLMILSYQLVIQGEIVQFENLFVEEELCSYSNWEFPNDYYHLGTTNTSKKYNSNRVSIKFKQRKLSTHLAMDRCTLLHFGSIETFFIQNSIFSCHLFVLRWHKFFNDPVSYCMTPSLAFLLVSISLSSSSFFS